MELSDDETLETILRIWEADQKARKHERNAAAYEAPSSKSFRRRCSCGACLECQENARWLRIYREKFEDREYYKRRSVPLSSPLSDL
jgi:hypothetical protein